MLNWSSNTLATWCKVPTHLKKTWWWERLEPGGEGGDRGWDGGWYHRLDGHEFEQALGVGDGQEVWHASVHGVAKSWTQMSYWTELKQEGIYFWYKQVAFEGGEGDL